MEEPAPLFSLSVKNNKNYCVSPHEILVHNFMPELSMVEFGLLEACAAAELAALDLVALGSAASGLALPVAGVLATGYLATKLYNNYYSNYEKMDANTGLNSLPGADANVLPALDFINSIDFSKTQNQGKLNIDFESKIFSCCPPAIFSGENKSSQDRRDSQARRFADRCRQARFEDKVARRWDAHCVREDLYIRCLLFHLMEPVRKDNSLFVRDHSDLTNDGKTGSVRILSIDLLTKEYLESNVVRSKHGLMVDWIDYNTPGNIFAFLTSSSANIKNLSMWVYCQGSCTYFDQNNVFDPAWLLFNNEGQLIEIMSHKRKPESQSVAYNTPAVIFFRKNESWPTKNGGTLIYDPSRSDGVLFERDWSGELLTKYDKTGKCLFSKELEAQKEKAMEALKKVEEVVVAAEQEYEKTIEDFENQVKNLVAQIKEAKEKETKDNVAKKDDQPQQENSQVTEGSSPAPGGGKKPDEDEEKKTCEEKHPGEKCDNEIDCGRRKLLNECEEDLKDEIFETSLKEEKLEPANQTLEEVFKEKNITFKKSNNSSANNINSQKLLKRKLNIVNNLKNNKDYVRSEKTLDGKIRFFKEEVPCSTPGPTRGAAYISEYDTKTGNFRSWMESYDHKGNIIRIHKKNIGGLDITGPHTPPTYNDYKNFNIQPPKDK